MYQSVVDTNQIPHALKYQTKRHHRSRPINIPGAVEKKVEIKQSTPISIGYCNYSQK